MSCKLSRLCWMLLGVCFLLSALEVRASAEDLLVKVDWIPDGDTLFLQQGEWLRIKGIDAPEMGGDGQPDQYFAHESRHGLKNIVQDKSLTLENDSLDKDRYGRILAHVRLPSGQLLSEALVSQGLAFYYAHPNQQEKYNERLLFAQRQAMQQNRGFWPGLLESPQASEPYVGNRRSKRFHTLDCSFGQRISDENRVQFSDLRQAFDAGFAPGRKCTPWPAQD